MAVASIPRGMVLAMTLAVLAARVARSGVDGIAILNVCLIVAAVILALLAVARLCGAAIAPRATWWGLLIAAAILFVVWLIV